MVTTEFDPATMTRLARCGARLPAAAQLPRGPQRGRRQRRPPRTPRRRAAPIRAKEHSTRTGEVDGSLAWNAGL